MKSVHKGRVNGIALTEHPTNQNEEVLRVNITLDDDIDAWGISINVPLDSQWRTMVGSSVSILIATTEEIHAPDVGFAEEKQT
jgi:hypothetical protein